MLKAQKKNAKKIVEIVESTKEKCQKNRSKI